MWVAFYELRSHEYYELNLNKVWHVDQETKSSNYWPALAADPPKLPGKPKPPLLNDCDAAAAFAADPENPPKFPGKPPPLKDCDPAPAWAAPPPKPGWNCGAEISNF